MDYKQICNEVCAIARRAGDYISRQRKDFSYDKVEFKGAQNLVSYVDKQAELMIVGALRELLPQAGFITEEGTAECHGEEYRWVIDPLDGTTNFIHGLPPYCVSIALMHADQVVVGVAYEITLSEMFCAWQGSKAYLNGEVIRVSQTELVENSLVAVGFSHSQNGHVAELVGRLAWFQENSNGIRRLGSSVADLAYVACGRFDAFVQERLMPWDVAAAAFIAERAGAVVTDYAGGKDYVFGGSIMATAPGVTQELHEILQRLA